MDKVNRKDLKYYTPNIIFEDRVRNVTFKHLRALQWDKLENGGHLLSVLLDSGIKGDPTYFYTTQKYAKHVISKDAEWRNIDDLDLYRIDQNL